MAYPGHIIIKDSSPPKPRRQIQQPKTDTQKATDMRRALTDALDKRPETGKMQRVKTLTREEKARAGIDALTRDAMASAKDVGRDEREEKVRSDMTKVAVRAEAKKDYKEG